MFSTLRTRFGIPGVISVIALVFAMFGGAYAASNSSGGGKATASAKAKKGPRGPKGATGPAGAQGPAGPAGAKGDAGANGANGANGTNGTSAEAISFSGNLHGCSEGGVEVKSAKPATFVCNGKKGADGQTGFTKTLPAGATETGTWAVSEFSNSSFFTVQTAISFPIPLAAPGGPGSAFFFDQHQTENEEFESSGCTGSITKPTAPEGKLCVYTGAEELTNASFAGGIHTAELLSEKEYAPSGVIIEPALTEGEATTTAKVMAYGSWAVTAPAAP